MSEQTIKSNLWVHAFYNKDGVFNSWIIKDYKSETKAGDYGFFVPVSHHLIELPVPDQEAANKVALEALGAEETRLRGKLYMELLAIQTARNRIMGLPAPEILDGVKAPTAKPEGDIDDIPF